jgi:hypothetical protein
MPLPGPSRRKTHNKTTAAKTVVPEYLCSDIATWLYPVSSGCNLILIPKLMDFKNNLRNATWLLIKGGNYRSTSWAHLQEQFICSGGLEGTWKSKSSCANSEAQLCI